MAEESEIVIIEEWSPVLNEYEPDVLRFRGKLFGHPKFPDGTKAITSEILCYDDKKELFIAKSRKYKLGEVDPYYERKFPDAKKKILEGIARQNS